MSDRHGFDDIKLIGASGLEPRDTDIKDLDDDLLANPDVQRALRADLGDDLGPDLLGDDFDDPMPRRRRKSSTGTAIGLILLLGIAGGGAYAYLNKDQLLPLVMGDAPRASRVVPAPGDLPPSVDPLSAPVAAVPAPAVPVPSADMGAPAVSGDAPPMPLDFSDLPQPDVASNDAVPVVDLVSVPVPAGDGVVVPTPVVPEPPVVAPPPVAVPEIVTPDVVAKPANDELKPVVPDAPVPVVSAPSVPVDVAPPPAVLLEPMDSKDSPGPDVGEADLSKIEEAMTPKSGPKDEYLESTTALNDLAEATAPRMNLTDEQKSMGLGVTVGKGAGESQSNAPKPPAAGAISGATASVSSVDVEGKIAAANRALDLERFDAAYDMFSDLYKQNARDERILMGRAVALQKLGREGEAVQAYDELIAINPNNPEVMINALTLVRKNNPTEALSRLMTLRQKYPTNATIAAQIGLVNAELSNFDDGLRYLNIAADLESTNPKHFFNMAVIAERMKRPDMAIDYYERALKADALSGNPKNKLNRDMVYDRLSYLRQAGNAGQ
jgi:tetratricopeptide (TPR) repeat protein